MSWGDALGRELTADEQLLIQTLNAMGLSKHMTVEQPSNTEDITMFRTNVAITVTKVSGVVRGSTPSIDFNIYHGSDRSGAGTALFASDQTLNNTATPDEYETFADATIPADSVIWFETSAKSGTVDEAHVTLDFTIDA